MKRKLRFTRARSAGAGLVPVACALILIGGCTETSTSPDPLSLSLQGSVARADQGELEKQGRLAEARKLLGEQRFAESLALLDGLLEINPNDSSVQRLRERVMEERKEHAKRIEAFRGFSVDGKLMKHASRDALVMHCLPAHRGEEISAEVIDGPGSVVFDQAENRLHIQKAVLDILMNKTRS